MRLLSIAGAGGVLWASMISARSEPAILEYSGIVSVDGRPFNGSGSFVFTIQETNGVTWWSSGEIPLEGSSNASPRVVKIPVTNGGYTVRLGDASLGMPRLEMETLQRAVEPQLRVWFNDSIHGWHRAGKDIPISSQISVAPKSATTTREQAETLLRELRELRAMYERDHSPVAPVVTGPPPPQELVTVSIKNSPSLGREDAPIALVEFIDFECGFCKQAQQTVMPELRAKYVQTGKLRLVVRQLAMSFHSQAEAAARAALCAQQQQKFWEMHDKLFALSPALTGNLLSAAEELNLRIDSFRACLETNSFAAEIKRDATEAMATGINGTPTFILGKISGDKVTGEMIVGAQSIGFFEAKIQNWLKAK